MGIETTFGRLRVENDSGSIFITDINTLVVPDTWLSITGPDEATLIVGDVDSLTSLTSITIDADTDANGSGTIALRTRNLARFTVNNDGTLTAAGKKLTIGDATVTDAAKIELKTQSAILVDLNTQTFNFVGTGPGGASYANHTFGLAYNVAAVAGDPTFSLNHEPKFSQAAAPYQTEIYYSWEDPTHTFSIRPWGMVIQHADGDNVFTSQGDIAYLDQDSAGGGQMALWHAGGFLEFFAAATSAQIQFPNNAPSIVGYNAAASSTIGMIKVNASDKVVVDPGGFGAVFGANVTGDGFSGNEFISAQTPTTYLGFDFPNLLTLSAGGNFIAVASATDFQLRKPLVWEVDNTTDLGIISGSDKRPRDIKAGRDIYAGGVLIAGTGPTTLTDAAGKILSAALNTVGAAQGGTGIASYAVGDILYASGATTLSKLADVAVGSVFISGGITTAPAWSTKLGLGVGVDANHSLIASTSVSAAAGGKFTNTSNNSAAYASLQLVNDAGTLFAFFLNSSANANYGGANTVCLDMAGNFNMAFATNDTVRMTLTKDGNLGIGTATFGTSATRTLAVFNGTAPSTGPADTVQFYSSDDAAGHTIPSFYCEGTNVVATGQADSASSVRVKIRINGTVRTFLCI